jgi:hypothetical protein
MGRAEKPANENKAKGRATAPGQDKVKLYQNEAGDFVTASKREWHDTYKAQGFRPYEAPEVPEEPETPPVDPEVEQPA